MYSWLHESSLPVGYYLVCVCAPYIVFFNKMQKQINNVADKVYRDLRFSSLAYKVYHMVNI